MIKKLNHERICLPNGHFLVFLDFRSLRRVPKTIAILFGLCLYVSSWLCDLFFGTFLPSFFLVDRNATPDGIRY
jgi:hypothetical protein